MAILEKLKLIANRVMSVMMKDNMTWIGNWPVDHKYGLLVLVGDNADGERNSLTCDWGS